VQADKDPWNTYFEFFGDLPTLIKPRGNALDPILLTKGSGVAASLEKKKTVANKKKTVAVAGANVEGVLQ
jgi:hypothetical protein